MLSALHRKLWRDLIRLRGQVVTIALVIAAGIASFVTMRGNYTSLEAARDRFYDQQRFGDVFAQLERAPESVRAEIAALPGIAHVESRIVKPAMLPLPQLSEPVRGLVVSLSPLPQLNLPRLRDGRLPDPAHTDEAVLLQGFADSHHLQLGDRIPVVINGKRRLLQIVGIAASPEYVMAMAAGSMSSDPERFAVLWLGHAALAAAFNMQGAFNDLTLELRPGASIAGTIDSVDRRLAAYGGLGAYARDRQRSNYMISGELQQLSSMALVLPSIFLAVALLLVNLVLSRLVYIQQAEIATLKALGYSNRQVGLYFLELVLVVSGAGSLLGLLIGQILGSGMLDLYARYFKFPDLRLQLDARDAALAVLGSFFAAATGALGSVRRAASIPPAEAMRPASPLRYQTSIIDRLGLRRFITPSAHMIVRELQRRPLRTLMSCLALAAATALTVVGGYYADGIEALLYSQFHQRMREDAAVTFVRPQPQRVLRELAHLPGVLSVEGLRSVPVRFRVAHRHRDGVILGYDDQAELRRPRDIEGKPVSLPPGGIVLTDILGEILHVRIGDSIEVELMEGSRAHRRLVVSGFMPESFGLFGHMRIDALRAFLDEGPTVSQALLRIDAKQGPLLDQRLKDLPAVVEVSKVSNVLRKFRDQSGNMILVMAFVIALFAATITIGVVYNNARVALSMRGRDLASLRVLGFTRGEISTILIGEQMLQVLLALPLGLFFGNLLVQLLSSTVDPEAYRIPMTLTARSYAFGVVVTLSAALLSALLVRRRLDQLDLIAVLKTRE